MKKQKIKVAVVRGGPSREHYVSLLTGKEVIKNLKDPKYEVFDVVIAKKGKWMLKRKEITPKELSKIINVAFNALHGKFGEDGEIQKVFEKYKIPYTGSGVSSSKITMDKWKSKKIVTKAKIKIPKTKRLLKKTAAPFEFPLVIKPANEGSSIGIDIVKNEKEYKKALEKAFKLDKVVLVEEYIKGREATCGVIENFRGKKIYPLPEIEIVPPETAEFFNEKVKYNGSTKEICPGRFDKKTKEKIKKMAVKSHKALGCRHYSRADMIVAKDGIYFLEVNTLPGLTSQSLLPKSAKKAGLPFPKLIDHLIKLALNKGL
jgi:D-alanine-D-alanine ligase